MDKAIEFSKVSFRVSKSFEISDLNLSVPTGSVYGFLGPNGSGKTTSIRLMMGQSHAKKGKISVLGYDIPRETPRALLHLGYVPERSHLFPSLSIREALWLHSGHYPNWDFRRAEALLDQFGLETQQTIKSLSKGQLGQLLILLALCQKPTLLILDEPTDGLDPVVRRQVLDALLEYVGDAGGTVFVSSHLVHELEMICDWVGVLDQGSLVAELPMQSFKSGIKRLRVVDPPATLGDTPFIVLSRERQPVLEDQETWVVRGWKDPMRQYFTGAGSTLRDVIDLDLEEAFVELLNSSRKVDLRS